jgi:hypothetical protein
MGHVWEGGLNANSGWTALLAGFIVGGAGVGMVNPTLANAAVGVVTPEHSGMASGINNTFRQVGIATGIAGLGAVFEHQIRTQLAVNLAGTPLAAQSSRLTQAVASGASGQVSANMPAGLRATFHHAAAASFTSALSELFLIAGIVALVGSAFAFVLVRSGDLLVHPGAAAPGAA